jgi:hypothetical protein
MALVKRLNLLPMGIAYPAPIKPPIPHSERTGVTKKEASVVMRVGPTSARTNGPRPVRKVQIELISYRLA